MLLVYAYHLNWYSNDDFLPIMRTQTSIAHNIKATHNSINSILIPYQSSNYNSQNMHIM